MPAAATADELLDRVRRSGLIPPAELDAALAALSPGDPPLPHLLAGKLLTPFQADRLAAGKFKGFLLGGYVILDKLGAGGMGQVFLAEHTGMRRLVAIKVLGVPAEDDPQGFERFLREARAAAAVNHPNIVQVFDLNKDGRLNYLVMEHIDGVTLTALAPHHGDGIPAPAAADYCRQVALALQHGHERGLIHRDVKPNNVMVDRNGLAKLLDLGLVRFERESDSKLTSQVGKGTILGTADYLAPEQAVDSSTVDIRADVYGLGATLYFLLAGHPLFPTGKTAQKLMWQQWREPTPIRDLRPDVSAGLADVLNVALAKKPDGRWATPQDFADALAPYAVPTPIDPALVPVPPLRKWTRLTNDIPPPAASGVSTTRLSRPSFGSAAHISLGVPPAAAKPPAAAPTLADAGAVTAASEPVPPLPEPPRPGPPAWALVAGGVGLAAVAAGLAWMVR